MAHFRYISLDGAEIELEDVEALALQIKLGSITEDTLLFDTETREWTAARFHDVFIQLTSRKGGDAGHSEEGEPAREMGGDAPEPDVEVFSNPLEGIALDPVDPPEGFDPLGAEEFGGSESLQEPKEVDTRELAPDPFEPSALEAVEIEGAEAEEEAVEGEQEAEDVQAPVFEIAAAPDRSDDSVLSGPPTSLKPALLVAVAVLVIVSGYLGFRALSPSAVESGFGPSAEGSSTGPRLIGYEDLSSVLDSVRVEFDLEDGPEELWLSGQYLSAAGSYPEIRSYWTRYGDFFEHMSAQESALVSRAFEMGLPSSSTLDEVMRSLEGDMPRRRSFLRDLLQMSAAAVALHDFLVENQSRIEYDPPAPGKVQEDPELEISTDMPGLNEAIWDRLDGFYGWMERTQGLRPLSVELQLRLLYGESGQN